MPLPPFSSAPTRDYAPVYNVKKMFGAKGDGVTDDTAAIQAAVNAMPVQGGEIWFPDGVYIITNTITIKAHGVSFCGLPSASTYADQPNMQAGVRGISVIQASITTFPASTPMLVWGELGTSKMWTGGGLTNMSVLGTKGHITPGDAVQSLNIQAWHIYDCIVGNVARGVYVSSDQPGGTSNVNIDRNIIYGLAGIGVFMDAGSDENYVRFNYVVNGVGAGIKTNGIGNTIIGNHINGTVLAGSGTADGSAFIINGQRNFVKDNDVLACASNGAYVAASHSQVINNHFNNPNSSSVANGAGIWVAGSGIDVFLSNNSINDNSNRVVYGIRDTTTGGVVMIGPHIINGYTTSKFVSTNNSFQNIISPGKLNVGSISDPTAFLSVAASTTAAASLNMASGTAPTSPSSGDLWFDGTHLQFQNGATTDQIDNQSGGAPSGAAGGDLGSTYPNPTVVKINGTSLSGLATGILKNTTATGVPSIAVSGTDYITPTGTETMSSKTLTTPIIAQVNDANGNPWIKVSATASATGGFQVTNNVSGGTVTLTNVAGGNAPTLFKGAGTGVIGMRPGSDSTGAFQVQKTAGTAFATFDSTNGRMRVGDSTVPTDVLDVTGNVSLTTAGNKVKIATGTNASAGTGTLSGGTVTISTTAVTANSLIFLTDTASSLTNVGQTSVTAKSAGTSFTVTSSNALDTSTFNWLIIN